MKLLKILFWGLIFVIMIIYIVNEFSNFKRLILTYPLVTVSISGLKIGNGSSNLTTVVLTLNASTLKQYILNSPLVYDLNSTSLVYGNGTLNETLWNALTSDPWNITYEDYKIFSDMARIFFLKGVNGSSCKEYLVGSSKVTVCDNESAYLLIPYYNNTTGYFIKIEKFTYPSYVDIPYVPAVNLFPYKYDYDEFVYVTVESDLHENGDLYDITYYLVVDDGHSKNKTKCGSLTVDTSSPGVYSFEGCYYMGIGPLYKEEVVVEEKNNVTYIKSWTTHYRQLIFTIKHFVFTSSFDWLAGANNTYLDVIIKKDNKTYLEKRYDLEKVAGTYGCYTNLGVIDIPIDSRDLIATGNNSTVISMSVVVGDSINFYNVHLNRSYVLYNYTVKYTLNGTFGAWDTVTTYKFDKTVLEDYNKGLAPYWVHDALWCYYSSNAWSFCKRDDDYLAKLLLWGIFNYTYAHMKNLTDFDKYFALTWIAGSLQRNESIKGYSSYVCLKCLQNRECPSWAINYLQSIMYSELLTNTTKTYEILINQTDQTLDTGYVNLTYVFTGKGISDFPHVNTTCGLAYLVDFKYQNCPCATTRICYNGYKVNTFPYIYKNNSKIVFVKGLNSKPFNLTQEVKVCTIKEYDLGFYANLLRGCK